MDRKRPNCRKGKSCSATCIEMRDRCLVDMPEPPSAATSRLRDKIKQLELFPIRKFFSDKIFYSKARLLKRGVERDIIESIQKGDKDGYNSHRQKVIDFNNKIVREGAQDKGLLKVPATWDRVMKVKKSYEKARGKIEDRLIKAAREGDRDKYDREERRLLAIQKKLGLKVGDTELLARRYFWDKHDGDENEERRDFDLRTRPFIDKLEGKLEKLERYGSYVEKSRGSIMISTDVKGYDVKMSLDDNGTTVSFTVDNSYSKPRGISKADSNEIASVVKEMFKAVTSSIGEGAVFQVTPYNGDGRGHGRRKAYERQGFQFNKNTGEMLARVDKDGKLVGLDWRQAVPSLEQGNF